MVVKTITITEEAYNTLKRLKKSDESFSEIIIEVAREKSNPLDIFFGVLRDSKEELDDLMIKVKEGRKKADEDARKKAKKIKERLYDSN